MHRAFHHGVDHAQYWRLDPIVIFPAVTFMDDSSGSIAQTAGGASARSSAQSSRDTFPQDSGIISAQNTGGTYGQISYAGSISVRLCGITARGSSGTSAHGSRGPSARGSERSEKVIKYNQPSSGLPRYMQAIL